MIVLDEQLGGRGIEDEIRAWHRGAVIFVTQLRPGTVIKGDAIPTLLQEQRQPTFVTLNAEDFWRRAPISAHWCIVSVALPDTAPC